MGAANATGRFITTLTSLPQKPFSTSARVLVFCVFSASQFSHHTIGARATGTARARASPAMTTDTKITMPKQDVEQRAVDDPSVAQGDRRRTRARPSGVT